MRTRIALAAAGLALGLFGLFRLVTQIPLHDLVFLVLWLAAALLIHDVLLSPTVLGVGRLLNRFVPARPRRYVQGGLIAAASITAIAVPMIYRAHSQPSVKALLEQNFVANLGWVLGAIAVATVVLYLIRTLRDRRTQDR